MKVIILAGGLGTRFAEETHNKPKPMIEIGGEPILFHIMKWYQRFIPCEFLVATGYLHEVVENYLASPNFKKTGLNATSLFTGEGTSTGGRIKLALNECKNEEIVMATYGDGVSNIDIKDLISFHLSHNKIATVTAVRPSARFGRLEIENNFVTNFSEKNQADEGWINGGFFVLNSKVREYLDSLTEPFEHKPLRTLALSQQLMAFKHHGFWQPMDTLREKIELEAMIKNHTAPWMN